MEIGCVRFITQDSAANALMQHCTGRVRQPAEGVSECGEQTGMFVCVRESHLDSLGSSTNLHASRCPRKLVGAIKL